jgi:hypothetical protein
MPSNIFMAHMDSMEGGCLRCVVVFRLRNSRTPVLLVAAQHWVSTSNNTFVCMCVCDTAEL